MDPDRPKARALADVLRALVAGLPHGAVLPAEHRIGQEHGVGPATVARAMGMLRSEGLIVTRPPYGTTVRRPERRQVRVPRGSTLVTVMPSPAQRREWGVPEGVPVHVLAKPSGEVEYLAADEVVLTFDQPDATVHPMIGDHEQGGRTGRYPCRCTRLACLGSGCHAACE